MTNAAPLSLAPGQKAGSSAAPARSRRSIRRPLIIMIGLALVAAGVAAYFVLRPAGCRPVSPAAMNAEANQFYVSTKYPGVKGACSTRATRSRVGQSSPAWTPRRWAQLMTEADRRHAGTAASADPGGGEAGRLRLRPQTEHPLAGPGRGQRRQPARSRGGRARHAVHVPSSLGRGRRSPSRLDDRRAQTTADRLRAGIKDAVPVPIRGRVQDPAPSPAKCFPPAGASSRSTTSATSTAYVYLPEEVTGAPGLEARIVLDAAQRYPIRAVVSYVADGAVHAGGGRHRGRGSTT